MDENILKIWIKIFEPSNVFIILNLCLDLLSVLMETNILINIGNLVPKCPTYMKPKRKNSNLIEKIVLNMPWNFLLCKC